MRRTSSLGFSALAATALLALGHTPASAQDPDDQKRGVARISVVNGEVSVRRGDSGEWVAAIANAPLETNDQISTGSNSRAEVQFDSGNVLRIGGEAVIALSQLEYNRYQMTVERGTVTFRVLRTSNADIEVDTSNVSVRPSKQGTYRIVVSDAESDVTARAGDVEVFTPRGSQWVYAGQTMQVRGTASDPEFQIVRALPSDEWDRWNDSRDRPVTASKSYQYVPPGVYGAEDLDANGTWVSVPQYGYVWQPTVSADWAPYQLGRWVWVDWYGWTWVSYDSWGWAPYHYGRWFNQPGYGWLWYPGVVGVRHYWSPALVGFFGFGGGGIGFGFGNVGWVPLAPYEVLHPWWGRAYYGRPGYINGGINVVNVNVVNNYRNAGVRNGFTAVSGEDFRAGRFQNFVRPSGEQLRQARSVNGPIPVAPDRANLRFSDRLVTSAVRAAGNSRVYSYRQPNPVQRLSFDEQKRGFSGGSTARQSIAPSATLPTVHGEAGGWQRFGAPRVSQQISPQVEPPRAEATTPSTSRGWNRFGDPVSARPQPAQPQPRSDYRNYTPPASGNTFNSGGGRTESLHITPPVVRERSYSGGGYARPSGGGSNAPRSSGGGNRGGGGSNRGGGGGGRR
jgi:hypothetical protein